jgi:anthranilate synthase component 1
MEIPKSLPKTRLHTLVREMPADLDTPVSVFLRLRGRAPAFLLESVTGGEQVARFSFIGVEPDQAFVLRGRQVESHQNGEVLEESLPPGQDPLDFLRRSLAAFEHRPDTGLPRFAGGLVGYLGYDLIRYFEPTVLQAAHDDLPDAIFLHATTLVAFDHAFGRLLLIASDTDRSRAEARLDDLQSTLAAPLAHVARHSRSARDVRLESNMTQEIFENAVLQAKEHIAAGDIFQVVPSQRLSCRTEADPFEIYRALRRLNPSPYMFYFDFANLAGAQPFRLIGASPEMHVRLENGIAALRPIAGTRPRGRTPAEDLAHEQELLADPKELAEHVMLIDLARNDLGRVCEYGSVHVPERMVVERYSHVMHIVSHTEGRLRPDLDAFDLMRATFPAGTVSGAPKIRAMQIITDLEPDSRGPYAGAVGYFGYDGSADTCIALRTLVMRGEQATIQAGAGIVADSDPELEYHETLNKARALAVAIAQAEAANGAGKGGPDAGHD